MSMSDLVLSASSVNTYLSCPLQWWFTYILAAEGETNEAAQVGIAVHDLVEKTLRSGEAQSWQATEKEVRSLAALWEREVWPTVGTPKFIEQQFFLDVDGIAFSGWVDYVTDAHLLCDLKNVLRKPQPGRYRLNMVGYWLGCQSLGLEPVGIRLDYLVRTKTPYYLPEMQDIPDEWEVASFAATLKKVVAGIEAREFPPTGLTGWACRYCPHRSICGPYAAMPKEDARGHED